MLDLMITFALSQSVYDCINERPNIPTAEWAEANVRMPVDSAIKGPFRLDLFPQYREPLECFDDPAIRTISIQAGSRNGKTVFAQVCLAKTAACNPHPMLWADASQASLQRVIRRTWRLLGQCPALDDVRPPERLQSKDRIELKTCTVHGAYPRSPASAADIDAWLIVCNELSKFVDVSTSKEAAFHNLVLERAKAYRDAKIINLSTPALKGSCLIEQARLAGDNRARFVPCPFCGHWQTLRRGNGKTPGGVVFDRLDGRLDPQKAKETAAYQCEKCRKRIAEEHRFGMLTAGLWVPEGCTIKRNKVTGTPVRAGNHASFGPLSTLHSMLPGTSLGDYAENLVKALTAKEGRREALRNHVNGWSGETWDPQPIRVSPSDLVDRLGVDIELGIVPDWAKFLTMGIDVGRSGEEYHFYFAVCAWGLHARGHLVDYGLIYTETELRRFLQGLRYPTETDEHRLPISQTAIDSGSMTQFVYELCRSLPGSVLPIKGSSTGEDFHRGVTGADLFSVGTQLAGLSEAEKRVRRKQQRRDLLIPHTHALQLWLNDRLEGLIKRDAPSAFTIPVAALELQPVPDVDLPAHLIGDVLVEGKWSKRYERQDMRDAIRYARVMAELATRGGKLWNRLRDPQRIHEQKPAKQPTKTPSRFSLLGDRKRPKLSQ